MSTTSLLHSTSVRVNGLMTVVGALQAKLAQLETCVVSSLNQGPAQDSNDTESRILGLETMAQDLYKRRMTDLQTIKATFADDLGAIRADIDGLKSSAAAGDDGFTEGQHRWLVNEFDGVKALVLNDLNAWKNDIIDYISSTTDDRITVLEKAIAEISGAVARLASDFSTTKDGGGMREST